MMNKVGDNDFTLYLGLDFSYFTSSPLLRIPIHIPYDVFTNVLYSI